jgi:hypothetical protein
MSAHDQEHAGGGVRIWLRDLGQADQEIGDESDSDLCAHGILAGAEEPGDPEVLLDPFEEQLDLPAFPIKRSDLAGRAVRSLVNSRSPLPVSIRMVISRPGWKNGRLEERPAGRTAGWQNGRLAERPAGRTAGWQNGRLAERIVPSCGQALGQVPDLIG